MYIVLFTTMGAASNHASVPVENVNASFRFCTLPVLIWSSRAESRAGEILCGPDPLAVIRLHLSGIRASFEVLLFCRILCLRLLAARVTRLKHAA